MKTKADKRVNRIARLLNRQLQNDVYGDRFFVRQVRKGSFIDCRDIHYYCYMFCDKKCPERNVIRICDEFEIINTNKLNIMMSSFIVESDFWKRTR